MSADRVLLVIDGRRGAFECRMVGGKPPTAEGPAPVLRPPDPLPPNDGRASQIPTDYLTVVYASTTNGEDKRPDLGRIRGAMRRHPSVIRTGLKQDS
jgi:hypothetical protein